jgi:hypothetical protein
MVKKFTAFGGTRKYTIIVFTMSRPLVSTLSQMNSVQALIFRF